MLAVEDTGSSVNGQPKNKANDSERLLLAPDELTGVTDAPPWLVLEPRPSPRWLKHEPP